MSEFYGLSEVILNPRSALMEGGSIEKHKNEGMMKEFL
jgi:hypothetical protein